MGRHKGQKNHGGIYRTAPLSVAIDSVLVQKLAYAVHSGFRTKPSHIVELALDSFFMANPSILDGFEEDPALEVKSPNWPGMVYLAFCPTTRLHKIGRSKNPESRLAQLSSRVQRQIDVVHTVDVPNMKLAEEAAHELFASRRKHGEWFELNESDVETFKMLHASDLCPPAPCGSGVANA